MGNFPLCSQGWIFHKCSQVQQAIDILVWTRIFVHQSLKFCYPFKNSPNTQAKVHEIRCRGSSETQTHQGPLYSKESNPNLVLTNQKLKGWKIYTPSQFVCPLQNFLYVIWILFLNFYSKSRKTLTGL